MLLIGITAYAEDTHAPSIELIEFLGEGIEVQEEIVDPLTWQAMEDMTGTKQTIRQEKDD